MARLQTLSLTDFRCFSQASFSFAAGGNVIVGPNASGKTALIEALWLLATGRSFRTARLQQVIRHGADEAIVQAMVDGHRLGWGRRGEQTRLRLDGTAARTQAALSERLPLQLLTPEAHRLLEAGPRGRRRFIDWGGFYHFPTFLEQWRIYRRALKQRNQALKRGLARSDVVVWDALLAQSGETLSRLRQQYVETLSPHVTEMVEQLLPELAGTITLHYVPGWRTGRSLAEALADGWQRDHQLGTTQSGPHRADLQVKVAGREAAAVLSRGQQKLFVCALLLAQARLFQQQRQEAAIMLIDDLPAELDAARRARLITLLESLEIQYLVTTTDVSLIPRGSDAHQVRL